MQERRLALIIEPEELERHLDEPGILVVDIGRAESYQRFHLPGAVHLDYAGIVATRPPVGGLLPGAGQLSRALGRIGLTPETHVVVYDDEGGGKAGRLIWTFDNIGHHHYSLLNGGLHAWANEGHPLSSEPVSPVPTDYTAQIESEAPVCADTPFILAHLDDRDVALLDARSPDEYHGRQRYSERAGHIPGAVNLNWVDAMDQRRNLRLKAPEELLPLLEGMGVTPDKTVVVYCQTHHRSAHTYVVLKSLGFPSVRGYPGSWSEWGNRHDTPVE